MQKLHILIFLLLIFLAFIGLNPSPTIDSINDYRQEYSGQISESSHHIISAWKVTTTLALKRECGLCHQSSRVDETTTALEVFDLDHSNWNSDLAPEILNSISDRAIPENFSETEVEEIKNFMEYSLAQEPS